MRLIDHIRPSQLLDSEGSATSTLRDLYDGLISTKRAVCSDETDYSDSRDLHYNIVNECISFDRIIKQYDIHGLWGDDTTVVEYPYYISRGMLKFNENKLSVSPVRYCLCNYNFRGVLDITNMTKDYKGTRMWTADPPLLLQLLIYQYDQRYNKLNSYNPNEINIHHETALDTNDILFTIYNNTISHCYL